MPASITCRTPNADRGEVRSGPPLTHSFRLTNPTAESVTVVGVETGCGCVRRDLSRDHLKPGETADLTLTINTLTQPAGPNTWRAVVRCRTETDPTDRQLELTVKASLVREVTVTPPELAFSTSGAARQTLTVTDRRHKPLTVLRAELNGSGLTVEVRPATTADGIRMQAVEVSVPADAPAGDWSEVVTLLTDDPAVPEMRIPVRVSKRPADGVTCIPSQVTLRFAAGQTTLSGVVQLRAGGKPVAVRSAAADHPAVRVTTSAAGPVAVVRVAVDAAGKSGTATVTLDVSDPAGQTVLIPVSWNTP